MRVSGGYHPNKYRLHRRKLGNWKRLNDDDALLNASLGLAGEAGEVIDHIKKWKYHGKGVDPHELLLELGDVYHYLDEIMHQFGYELSDVMEANHKKLLERAKLHEAFPSSKEE